MVGSFTLPAVAFLQALRLRRDDLVQALGRVLLTFSLIPAAGLERTTLLAPSWLALSVLPSLMGTQLGRRLRHRL
jgi:hypothetical protein